MRVSTAFPRTGDVGAMLEICPAKIAALSRNECRLLQHPAWMTLQECDSIATTPCMLWSVNRWRHNILDKTADLNYPEV